MYWLRIALIANAALFALDRIWDVGVVAPIALALTGFAYLRQRERGARSERFVLVGLLMLAALTILDLLDAGLLPVVRI